MKVKLLCLVLALGTLQVGVLRSASANAELQISGKHYSTNDRELGIQRGRKVYFIRKSALLPAEVSRISNSGDRPVTVRIDLRALTRVVDLSKKATVK